MSKALRITLLSLTGAAAICAGVFLMRRKPAPVKSDTEWAVYMYVCGSDLESEHSAASEDIDELISAPLPGKTEVVIQTGGSRDWTNGKIDADKICRLVYSGDSLKVEDKDDLQNMGDPQTLSDFLFYCFDRHPAKHTMLVIWNHGGGTLGGVAYDTVFNDDSLSLPELEAAFDSIIVPDGGGTETGRLLDIIGFDACLMSTLDTADVCSRYADWMIASQQLEPVCGWNYTSLAGMLENPQELTPKQLGISVCDAFYEGCDAIGLADASTLALTDLSAVQALKEAYEDTVCELFDATLVSDESMAEVRKMAGAAENYGVNGKAVGYTDMVDLLEFIGGKEESADEVRDAIDKAVVYKALGDAAGSACGLSAYYPLDASIRSVFQYGQASGASKDITLFFRYLIDPQMSDAVAEYADRRGISRSKILTERYQVSEEDLTVTVPQNARGDIVLEVEPEKAAKMAGFKAIVSTELPMENTEFPESGRDEMYYIRENGERECSLEDYEDGRFTLERNIRLAFAGGIELATYISSIEDDMIKYYSPVVIDGHDGFFLFAADRDSTEISFLGQYYGDEHEAGRFYLGDDSDTETVQGGGSGSKSFIGRRIYPLKSGQTVCALHSTMLSSLPDPYADGASIISRWEESEPFVCDDNTRFEFASYDYGEHGIDGSVSNTFRFAAEDESGMTAYSVMAAAEPYRYTPGEKENLKLFIMPEGVKPAAERAAAGNAAEPETSQEEESAAETESEAGTRTQTTAAGTTAESSIPESSSEVESSTEESEETTARSDSRHYYIEDSSSGGGGHVEPTQPAASENETTAPAESETDPPETSPTETTPPETSPTETTPPETSPTETTPTETSPAETTSPETTPSESETTSPEPLKCSFCREIIEVAESGASGRTCDKCHRTYCDSCAPDVFITCVGCKSEYCGDCMKYCSGCNNPYCDSCLTACYSCGNSYCDGCGKEFLHEACAECGNIYCVRCDNGMTCEQCGGYVCFDDMNSHVHGTEPPAESGTEPPAETPGESGT